MFCHRTSLLTEFFLGKEWTHFQLHLQALHPPQNPVRGLDAGEPISWKERRNPALPFVLSSIKGSLMQVVSLYGQAKQPSCLVVLQMQVQSASTGVPHPGFPYSILGLPPMPLTHEVV